MKKNYLLIILTVCLFSSPLYPLHYIKKWYIEKSMLEPEKIRWANAFNLFQKGQTVFDKFTVIDTQVYTINDPYASKDSKKTITFKEVTIKSIPNKYLLREETFTFHISFDPKDIFIIDSSVKWTPLGKTVLGVFASGLGGAYLTATYAPSYFNWLVESATPRWLSPLTNKLQAALKNLGIIEPE